MRKRGLFPAAAPRRGYNPTHPGAKRAAFAAAPAARPRRRPPCTRPARPAGKARRCARPARPAGFGPVCPVCRRAAPPPGNGPPARPRPPQARRARPNAPPRFSAAPPPKARHACARRKPLPRPAPCARRKAAARAARGLAARPGVYPPPQGSDRPAPGCARARAPRRLACAPKGGSNPRARFAGDRAPLSRKFPRNSGPGV